PQAMPRGILEPRAPIQKKPARALPSRVYRVGGVFDGQIAKDEVRTVRHPHGSGPATPKAQGLEGNPRTIAELQLRLIGNRVDAGVQARCLRVASNGLRLRHEVVDSLVSVEDDGI